MDLGALPSCRILACALAIAMLALAGCLSPIALHEAVIEYDRAANRIQSDMLLLNIARAHHFQPLHFTAVSSVAATFDFTANVGIFPTQAERNPSPVSPGLGVSVAERPTITIVPIEGEDFTRRILAPMDSSRLSALFQQGADFGLLFRLMAKELVVSGYGESEYLRNDPSDREQYMAFRRRVLHLSSLNLARSLYVGPIVFEDALPISIPVNLPPGEGLAALDKVMLAQEKGYYWNNHAGNRTAVLTKQVIGRIAITNYDISKLPNEVRRRLNEEANQLPQNAVLVDVRPGDEGGDYPLHGYFVLRSFHAMMRFIANGIDIAPEFHVEKDARTGEIAKNPPWTLLIEETDKRPNEAAFAIRHESHWYSIRRAPQVEGLVFPWNQEAFRLLNHLYQMTVTELRDVPTPAITIAK
ncbi:MAG: hypothetical protein R3B37_03160 [Nitrospira sp.]|nr:hypothetical protein [Nitrospira sp.]